MKPVHNPYIHLILAVSALAAYISVPTVSAANLTWDNGATTGNWNTTQANWTGSTWSNVNPDNAVFNNRNETVTLTEAITAGSLSFLAGGRQSGTHLLTLTGSSLSLASITVNGQNGGNVDNMTEASNQRLKLNNISVSASGNVSVARGSLEVSGTTSLNITGKLLATGDWSGFVMGAGTSVTATGGVDFYNSLTATNIDLNGGTLITPYIYGNKHSSFTNVVFNGTKVVATTDNADFLQVHQSGSAVTRASAVIRAGGLIFDTDGHDVTIANVLANYSGETGTLTKIGAGTLTLSSANTYTGTTTVNGGTLTISGASVGSGAIKVASVTGTNATLNIQNGTYALGSNSFQVGDASNATGTVKQSGGAVSFTGGNGVMIGAPSGSYAGSVGIYNLSGGSISVANASNSLGVALGVNSGLQSTFNLSGSGNLTLSNSTLQIGRSSWFSGSNTTNLFNQTGGTASISTLTMGGNTGGSAGVTSTLTLTGGTFSASTFTILAAGNTNTAVINIGGTADVTLPALPTGRGSGSTATLNFDGGTLRPYAASTAYISGLTNAFILDGGAKIDVASGKDITITQNLLTDVSSTGGGLTKAGLGNLTLTGNNTYTGATTIDAGTLQIGNGGATGALAGSSAISGSTGATLAFNRSDSVTVSNTISGGLGLTKSGVGTLTLNGANTYTGGVTINGGELKLGNTGALNSTAGSENAVAFGASSTGTLTLNGESVTIANLSTDATPGTTYVQNNLAGTATLTVGNSTNLSGTFAGVIQNGAAGTLALIKSGTGTLTLTGANTYTGTTTVKGGTLTLSGASALSGSMTVASVAGTNATLEIQNGTYALGGNSFQVGDASNATGTVNQSGGAVSFTGGNGLLIGAPSGSKTGSVGIYNLSGGSVSAATGNNLGLVLGVNSGLQATFNLSGSGNLTVSSGRLQLGRSDWTSSNTTNLFNQTGGTASISTLTMGGNSNGSTGVSSTLSLTGGTFSASSFTILAAGNTNTAVINIGGTADVTLPALPTGRGSGSTATLNFDGGTLRPFAASSNFIGGLTNAFILDGGAKIDVASGKDITITQNLLTDVSSTGGGLAKDGVGSLTLTGANTYTGATAVSAGKLVVNGNISTSSLTTVAATAALGGTGTVGAMTISGILAPGNSIGTITSIGDVTWNDNDAWVFELGSPAASLALANSGSSIQDMLNITGIGSDFLKGTGSSFTFDFANTGAVGFYKLVDWTGISNFSAGDFLATNLTSGLTATFTVDGGTSALYLNVVPEPNAAALVGGFGMFALLRRRRR